MLTLTVPAVVKFKASMLGSIVYDAMGPIWGSNFGWKAFWDSNPEG